MGTYRKGKRPSAVSMVTSLRTEQVGDRSLIPGRGKSFPLLRTVQTGSGTQQTFNSAGSGVFAGGKLAGV